MEIPHTHTFPGHVTVDGYIHKIYGYRYNWHVDAYEIDIVLKGTLEFVRNGEKFVLHQDDLIIINPGDGHASYPLEADTAALVLHFSAKALNDFTPKGKRRSFSFVSNAENRGSQACRLIRYYAAHTVAALYGGCKSGAERNLVRSSLGMISYLLSTQLPSQLTPLPSETQLDTDSDLMNDITTFICENYAEKLTLQDIADRFHYNRTYISSLFKQAMNIGFHGYLTRMRLHFAILDLGDPSKNLSIVALEHGFPDLKSFNQRFTENFHITPKEYRVRILKEPGLIPTSHLFFLDPATPEWKQKLQEYLTL